MGMNELNLRTSLNQSRQNFGDEDFESVSTRASDELYLVCKTYCMMVETFYNPLLHP